VPAPTCTDGVENGGETDVDCGGPTCAPCADGHTCAAGGDCQSGDCQSGACVEPPPTCTDGIKNGGETDVDCGGPTCAPCADNAACVGNGDCQSADCQSAVCVAAPVCTPEDYTTGQGLITGTPSGRSGTFTLFGENLNGAPTGHVNYDDDGSSEHLQSTSVTSYTITGPNSRQIQGQGTLLHKTGTVTYTVNVTDNGSGGDVFTIVVSDGYHATGTLAHGDIAVVVDCK
jgi:hypothetical protein